MGEDTEYRIVKMVDTLINNKWYILLPEHRAARPEWPTWEQERLQSMFETTKKGDVVYYIGAEIGDMAALLAMWGAEVMLFEPNKKAWPQLRLVFEANKVKPLGAFPGFASDKTDFKYLKGRPIHEWPDWVNGEVVSNHGFKELIEPGDIPQIKIDDVVEEPTIPPPNMITLDVEGAEGRVLRGAEQTLKEYHPLIYLSLHYDFLYKVYGEDHWELRKWIKDLGYKETLLGEQAHEQHVMYAPC